jgi:hypothetical protein
VENLVQSAFQQTLGDEFTFQQDNNLVQSAFQQTLGDEFTFQQDNNRKHKAKLTLDLLTKKTLYNPGVQSS